MCKGPSQEASSYRCAAYENTCHIILGQQLSLCGIWEHFKSLNLKNQSLKNQKSKKNLSQKCLSVQVNKPAVTAVRHGRRVRAREVCVCVWLCPEKFENISSRDYHWKNPTLSFWELKYFLVTWLTHPQTRLYTSQPSAGSKNVYVHHRE